MPPEQDVSSPDETPENETPDEEVKLYTEDELKAEVDRVIGKIASDTKHKAKRQTIAELATELGLSEDATLEDIKAKTKPQTPPPAPDAGATPDNEVLNRLAELEKELANERAEKKAQQARALREKLAEKKGLDKSYVPRITASNEDDIDAQIDDLLTEQAAFIERIKSDTPKRPAPPQTHGGRQSDPKPQREPTEDEQQEILKLYKWQR